MQLSLPYFVPLLYLACSFLLGAVPFGLVIAKISRGIDPRTAGSRNVGATNVARLCGVPWGVLTLAADLLKGFCPVSFAVSFLFPQGEVLEIAGIFPAVVAVAAVFGHMFSPFLGFKGGKGVASTVGVFLALAPLPLLGAALACVLVIWRTRFVSAGSLVLIVVLPLLLAIGGHWPGFGAALIIGCFVAYAHRENIKRLRHGEEKPWLASKPAA